MRLAWFRPATLVSERFDDSAALAGALAAEHEVELFDEARAHDFIPRDFREPFDLCVFELADTRPHAFVWPYLLHTPGVLRLRSLSLHDSRCETLRRQRRDRHCTAELDFGGWDLIAAPILRSRLTVVADDYAARRLQGRFPTARIRVAPLGLSGPGPLPDQVGNGRLERNAGRAPIVGALEGSDRVIQRAVTRARDAGAPLELITGSPDIVLARADIIIATAWPPVDEPTRAMAAMAAGRAVIILETEATAGWPVLDPQTWQPRGWSDEPPIAIALDPRDEEHSLVIALRRLATDAPLRETLGASAALWSQRNATLDQAVHVWRSILEEAAVLPPPPRPDNWPSHLTADGTERAREMLAEFGCTVDFLGR